MAESPGFANLVSLACHDLRTPLATVAGFATTLARDEELGEQPARYVGMIEAAAVQLGELVDTLAIVARIEAGRYEPALEEQDTLELARAAARRLGGERATADGQGAPVQIDPVPTERAVAALALAALRHGSLERVQLQAAGVEIHIGPVAPETAPILLGQDLRDLGAATAGRLLAALGGAVEVEGQTLRLALPASGAGVTDAGP